MLSIKQRIARCVLMPLRILPVKKKRISFICYNCTQYSCNPKYISEYIHENYDGVYELNWFYTDDHVRNRLPDYVKKSKKNSLQYFVSLMTSEFIISNVTLPRIVPFRAEQKKINTWHGTAFKGDHNKHGNDYNRFDYFLAENELTAKVLKREDSFNYTGEIVKIGMPRNDFLIRENESIKMSIKRQLGIQEDEKIILYAPTFRESVSNAPFNIQFDRLISQLSMKFGGTWKVLFRYHHMQKGKIDLAGSVDVTSYPDMQQLLLVSDILITDYSSTMWDFSLMNKPVFLYAEDIDRYIQNERGEFYWPLEKLPFYIAKNNDELADAVKNFDQSDYIQKITQYHKDWGRYNYAGNATEIFVKKLIEGKKGE